MMFKFGDKVHFVDFKKAVNCIYLGKASYGEHTLIINTKSWNDVSNFRICSNEPFRFYDIKEIKRGWKKKQLGEKK